MHAKKVGFLITMVCSGLSAAALAQQPQNPQSPEHLATANTPTQSPITAKLGTYVFPANGQSASQQQSDESYCYNWAKTQTNFDPMTAAPPQQSASTGYERAPAQGATRGAAVGAVGGAIGGNAGKGAAIGATVGLLKGGRDRRRAADQQQQQTAQYQQQLDAATGQFKKAFSACLESKHYTVK
jgi:hypothetical protein